MRLQHPIPSDSHRPGSHGKGSQGIFISSCHGHRAYLEDQPLFLYSPPLQRHLLCENVIPRSRVGDNRIVLVWESDICFPRPAASVRKCSGDRVRTVKDNQTDHIEALCHCLKCKRSNGSSFSTNLIVPASAFELRSGSPAHYTSKGQSGKDGSSHFCSDCGSPLYVTSELAAGVVIVKAGTLDDLEMAQTTFKPTTEMFCTTKHNWLPAIEGAVQLSGAN